MTRDGKAVQPREPMAHCAAFGTGPMPPGAFAEAEFSWDQKRWDSGVAEDAPKGAYAWSFTFTAYDNEDGDGAHRLTVEFHVIVGET